jgi:hypothetical protein
VLGILHNGTTKSILAAGHENMEGEEKYATSQPELKESKFENKGSNIKSGYKIS